MGQQRLRWGAGMGSGGVGGLAGKAGSMAALIYVPADIKGLCTWLFPNHYRRTINYGRSLIAVFCKWKRDNKCMTGGTGMRLWRLGWEVGIQNSQGKQVPIFGKEATWTQPPPPFLLLLWREMGVKPKTGNSTLTQKRANVNNQMNDTWPELQCERCPGLALFWLHKHLVTRHSLYWTFPPPSRFLC